MSLFIAVGTVLTVLFGVSDAAAVDEPPVEDPSSVAVTLTILPLPRPLPTPEPSVGASGGELVATGASTDGGILAIGAAGVVGGVALLVAARSTQKHRRRGDRLTA